MVRSRTGPLARLEAAREPLFLSGGILVVLFGVILGLRAFTALSYPQVGALCAGTGGTLAFLGLLGFYPELSVERDWLAVGGGVAAVIGAIGFAIVGGAALGALLGLENTALFTAQQAANLLVLIGMIPGFGLFAVAAHLAGHEAAANQLAAPAVAFGLVFVTGILGLTSPALSAGLGTIHGLSYLVVWLGLRRRDAPAGATADAADSMA